MSHPPRDFYGDCAGRDFGDTHGYEVFAALREMANVVRVMNCEVDRERVPPDQRIWLGRPVRWSPRRFEPATGQELRR